MRQLFAITLSLLALLSASATAAPGSALHLTQCTAGKSKLPAHCGTLRVFENRESRTGRTLDLHFIVIDAEHPTNRAIVFNPGGPGGDDLSIVPYIADGQFLKAMRKLHPWYNLVFLDVRGTGKSHALDCALFPNDLPQYYFRQMWPDTLLRACRAELSKTADLNMYTTDITVGDIDDLRAALGYPKLVLYGGSYGTMLYLDYARRYPTHVESVVLDGVAPPGFVFVPLQYAQGGQKAMTDLIADCAKDAVCHSHFPDLAAHFDALVQRFDRGPVEVPVVNPTTKRLQNVPLAKEVFADRLRDLLYADEGAAYVPYIVQQAYEKNYGPLGQAVAVATKFFWRGSNTGLNLSVTCAEDIPFITEAEVAKTSAGSFIGDTRVRAQQHACAIWNVNRASTDFATPVRSTAPVLMLSAAEDPATPLTYAREELPYLTNARQIVIPNASHETELDCEDDLVVQFVRTRDAKRLDAARCVGSSKRPPFATSMKGFPS